MGRFVGNMLEIAPQRLATLLRKPAKPLIFMVRAESFELPTLWV
jgi:hypothetical protein